MCVFPVFHRSVFSFCQTTAVIFQKRSCKNYHTAVVRLNGCGSTIDQNNSAGHHIDRHADGGRAVPENHAEVCKDCHKDLHSGSNK